MKKANSNQVEALLTERARISFHWTTMMIASIVGIRHCYRQDVNNDKERERESELLCVCVCVREIEREREREREREGEKGEWKKRLRVG